ncbi:hypothetical protein Dsin_024516 [Dipteronia sinensis]|uniref:Reverse transcriptase n=1 Tax=Dipteronia sinensis TaxID=43782 RepID=A0AAD9ZUN3_9ROSI|nr:hypothetical protein Dsin_024516 [Dipteronia sinensis]
MKREITKKKEELVRVTNVVWPGSWKLIRIVENQLDGLLSREEVYWRQRSRVAWLRNGDSNIRFFHAQASCRRLRNKISGLIDERWICPQQADLDEVLEKVSRQLSYRGRIYLDTLFKTAEIQKALFAMSPSKTLGGDGFPAIFYQKHWDIVGYTVTITCLGFLNNGDTIGDINTTLITLIPKVKKA